MAFCRLDRSRSAARQRNSEGRASRVQTDKEGTRTLWGRERERKRERERERRRRRGENRWREGNVVLVEQSNTETASRGNRDWQKVCAREFIAPERCFCTSRERVHTGNRTYEKSGKRVSPYPVGKRDRVVHVAGQKARYTWLPMHAKFRILVDSDRNRGCRRVASNHFFQ